jgi:hypothetical protein
MGHAREFTEARRIFVCEMQFFLKKAWFPERL